MFSDSASGLIRPHNLKEKPDLLLMVERYAADVGQLLCAFRADVGFSGNAYVRILRRPRHFAVKVPAPGTPKHNAPVESSARRAANAGRLHGGFPDISGRQGQGGW